MPDALALIAGGIQKLSSLVDLRDYSKAAEFAKIIADLKVALADALTEVSQLKTEIVRLREQERSGIKNAQTKDRLRSEDGKYFLRDPAPGEHAGPFCVKCFHDKAELVPLGPTAADFAPMVGKWECPVCRGNYP